MSTIDSKSESFIPYSRQNINDADVEAVIEVLRSDFLTTGPEIEKFERVVADFCGAKYAVAVSSATAGLHLACLAADLKPGDSAWTSPNSFVASANCALYCGAKADFVDIDPQTLNMSVDLLAKKLAWANERNALPKVVIPVHFAGEPCDLNEIAELKRRYAFTVIEDASHSVGATYGESRIGACAHSDMTVFSFHPVKIVTTGEGGMVLTNREDLYRRLLRLRTHGITRDPREMTSASDGPWYYQQIDLGLNYRMTDIQAALGRSQMARLEQFVDRRQELVDRYDKLLEGLPLKLPVQSAGRRSAHHLYPVQVLDEAGRTRSDVYTSMHAAGIGVNVHYIPIPSQPYFRALGFNATDYPCALEYYERAISLPLYAGLTDQQQDRVVGVLRATLLR